MPLAGIEAMNAFGGSVYLNVTQLARHRRLDLARFNNLMMKEKAVALPYEDPVTFAVNAAKPIVDRLTKEEKKRIELLITTTESGIDFGKSISTYIHHYLQLSRNCRLFELKQACYSGTAGLQMAVNFIISKVSPGAKALVIASDIARHSTSEGEDVLLADWAYAEPSAGAGAVAFLVGEKPVIFSVDVGANGYYGYEVMDTCRPVPDSEAGDSDLSLLSYLDCCEQSFLEYQKRVEGVDYINTFGYLIFHSPFGGMVKGAHRNMMRKMVHAPPSEIEADFQARVVPGLKYCQRVGNIMGGTLFLALASTIDQCGFDEDQRIGCFSYGSGCCSEFFSGIVTPKGKQLIKEFAIEKQLNARYELSIEEYESLLKNNTRIKFGTRNMHSDLDFLPQGLSSCNGTARLFLKEIKEFHREYDWSL